MSGGGKMKSWLTERAVPRYAYLVVWFAMMVLLFTDHHLFRMIRLSTGIAAAAIACALLTFYSVLRKA
jgi:hypothetical protein